MPSTVTLSQEVTLQWPDSHELFAILTTHMPACRLQQPGFPFELSFVYDFDRSRYALRWSGVQGIQIAGGLVLARAGARRVMDVALPAGTFPAYPHGALYSSDVGEQERPLTLHIEITVTLAPPAGPPLERTLREERQLNAVSSATARFSGRMSSFSAASPYFKTLFSTDFAENSTTNSFETLKSILSGAKSDETHSSEDSDDETDASLPPASLEALPNVPFKLVKITDTSYTTYANVLVWLISRYIAFAPLSSSIEGPPPSTRLTRLKALQTDPALPLPASPKSIYRLAHLLSLSSLSSLALSNLRTQLTPQNAAYELYSSLVSTYPAVRDVVLDYVVEHWSEVVESSGLREMEERAGREELPDGAAQTGILLARRLTKRREK